MLDLAIAAAATVLAIVEAAHALLNKRRPQSALGWIAVSLMVPFFGPFLYYLFGINRVRTRARSLRGRMGHGAPPGPVAELAETMGNDVRALHGGEEAFPAMLAAIRTARRCVYLSTYIFDVTEIGRDFIDALAEAVSRGVVVRVLLDGIGELYTWPRAGTLLAKHRVRVARFLPPRLLPPTLRINLRNHRKLLLVDGVVAFAGGMNIAARHLAADPRRAHRVVDMHFRFEGPVVSQLEETFRRDWRFTAHEELPESATASATAAGDAVCRVVPDGPDEHREPLIALLQASIAKAERRVAIMTPYFLPTPEIVGVLQAAALRGIDVDVVLPERNNLPYVHWATRHMLWEVLIRGVRVFYQPPPFAHTKLLLIDEAAAIVGSWNFDPRSLRLNFELAIEVRDRTLTPALVRYFDSVRARSRPVTLEEVDSRPLLARVRDGVAWLLTPYL